MGEGASFLWRCLVGDAQHSGNNLVCAMEGAGWRGKSEQWWASDPLIELEMEFRRKMNRSSPVYVLDNPHSPGSTPGGMGFQYELDVPVPRDRQKALSLLRASGDGQWVADALASPRAPARYPSTIVGRITRLVCLGGLVVACSLAATFSKCDVNQDGVTNVADLQKEINQALGVSSPANDLRSEERRGR